MFRDLWTTWSEEAALKAQIDEIEKRNRELEQEIEDLAPGGPGIEKTVREELGWSKKNEIVIRIPGKK